MIDAVHAGKIAEVRLNEGAVRILTQKFQQGLLENPHMDEEQTSAIVDNAKFRTEA